MSQWIPLIILILQTLGAVIVFVGIVVSWGNRKKLQEIHVSINSRLSQLLEVTADKKFAEGVKQEKDVQERIIAAASEKTPP